MDPRAGSVRKGRGPAAADEPVVAELGTAFDQGAIAMCLTSLAGRVVRVNRAFAELAGRSPDELCGRPLAGCFHADDAAPGAAELDRLLTGRATALRAERRLLRADGEVTWTDATTTLVCDRAGRPRGLLVQLVDITERQRITEALVSSERRLRLLAEGAEDFVLFRLRTRPHLEMEYVSPGVTAITGHTPADFHGDPGLFLRLVHPDDARRLTGDLAAGPGDIDHPFVYRWIRADGRSVWTQARIIPVLDARGAMVGIEGIAHDVTARHQAEAALRRSERRFRSLVLNASDIIVVTDARGRVDYASPSVSRVTGDDAEALVGTRSADLVHPEDAARVAAAFAGQAPKAGPHPTVEFRVRHREGGWRWLEATATNLLDDDAVAGLVVNARDITERKSAEAELAHQALHDPLTDLPNRALFLDRLEHALRRVARSRTRVAVVFIDVDHFKLINDSLGHQAGDRMLQALASRLSLSLRQGDTAARLGGDEFVACLEDLSGETEALEVARRILQATALPLLPDTTQMVLSSSIGVAIAETAVPAAELLADADLAMYAAKERGRNRIELFDPAMRRRLADREATPAEWGRPRPPASPG